MLNIKKWLQEKKAIARRDGGMEEKKQAIEMKNQVSLRILSDEYWEDRRMSQIPVQKERRREIYNYHQKLA